MSFKDDKIEYLEASNKALMERNSYLEKELSLIKEKISVDKTEILTGINYE